MAKKKAKAKAKIAKVKNKFEKVVEVLDSKAPFRTCYVCERESRNLQMIAPTKYRCKDCYPGSANWFDYLETHPEVLKHPAVTFAYNEFKKARTK